MKLSVMIPALLTLTIATGAAWGDIVDQSFPDPPTPPTTGGDQFGINLDNAVYPQYLANIGQTFTPTLSSLNFFTLYLEDRYPGNNLGGSFYVQILGYNGSTYGDVLGTSETLTVPDSFGSLPSGVFTPNDAAPAQFLFSSPVVLSPGTTYEAEIFKTGGDSFWAVGANPGGYGGGTYTGGGGGDFYFSEGIKTQSVPEPSSLFLLGLAGAVFTGYRTLRKMSVISRSSHESLA